MARFRALMTADAAIDLKDLQLDNATVGELVARFARAYGIELPRLV